jgi:hypothetical protein
MHMPIPDEVPGDPKLAANIVNAAQDLIDKISSFIPSETRGIVIQISNMTGLTLVLKTTDFSSGRLEPSVLPAPVIGPFSQTVFGVKSTGITTGVVGSVTYESDGIDVLLCGFNNPFVGSTAVNFTLTGSRAPTLFQKPIARLESFPEPGNCCPIRTCSFDPTFGERRS